MAARQHASCPLPEALRQEAERCTGDRTNRLRHHLQPSPKPRCLKMAIVATEQFIAAVAGERDRNLLSRKAANQESWDLRRIGKRLVVNLRQQRDDFPRLAYGDEMLAMHRPQVPGDLARIIGLVEA